MIVVGVKNGVVDICVSIRPEQLQEVLDMYPDHQIIEQVGDENIGWLYNGVTFTQG